MFQYFEITKLKKGDTFGELALQHPDNKRTGTIMTYTDAQLEEAGIPKEMYDQALVMLTDATKAYGTLLHEGRYGFCVLNIEMNPELVDVNVHPAKLEVRFEEENKVFQSIYHAIKDTLLKNDLVSNTTVNNLKIRWLLV